MQDYLINGRAVGPVADRLVASNGDVNVLRPWRGRDGHTYITTVNNEGKYVPSRVHNANATLRKDEWKLLDDAVVRAAKPRLRAVADLRGRGLQFVIPNGMSKTVLETEAQSDISAADISMDGMARSDFDRPQYSLSNLPLPIIHKDFWFPARQVMVSRNGATPLDTSTAELAGRRVAEQAEKLLLGALSSYQYGGGTVYGYKNSPNTISKTLTAPTASGWAPSTLLSEVLNMKKQSQAANHFGPWMLYNAPNWDEYLDDDFSTSKGDNTLRQRLEMIDGIERCTTLDYLTNFDLLLVQMTADVVREVVGMEITTVQWETEGGMSLHFKVMAIMVPQIRADYSGNAGIVVGATP